MGVSTLEPGLRREMQILEAAWTSGLAGGGWAMHGPKRITRRALKRLKNAAAVDITSVGATVFVRFNSKTGAAIHNRQRLVKT